MEAVRVEQAQAGKVAVLTELFRGRGEQQHARDDLSQLFDQGVLRGSVFRMPNQVVRFVDHHQVPASGKQRILGLFVLAQPFQRDQGQLAVFKRVAGIAFDKTLFIEQRNIQVEASAHFHQPLVLEVFRYQDQHPARAP